MFEAALIDLYDTLVWTDWARLGADIERRTGLDPDRLGDAYEETQHARNSGAYGSAEGDIAAVLIAAGYEPKEDVVAEMLDVERAFLAAGVHLHDDAVPTLRQLRTKGIRTALVSNCDHASAAVAERLGLGEEVDASVLSYEVRSAKPEPGIYRVALHRLGVPPERAVFVDDQAGFCDGAAALGITTFLIQRGGDPDPPEAKRHPTIPDLATLVAEMER